MTNRTVKVLGWGSGTAEITASLDGATVFSGSADLSEMTENNDAFDTAPTLFTFEIPMDFVGTKHMIVTVKDSAVRFGQIVANYAETHMGAITYSTGPDEYVDVVEIDPAGIADPRGDEVTIDGEKQKANRLIGKGTWHWDITPGSTFEHNLIISVSGLLDD
jgi:hypothetical protein